MEKETKEKIADGFSKFAGLTLKFGKGAMDTISKVSDVGAKKFSELDEKHEAKRKATQEKMKAEKDSE